MRTLLAFVSLALANAATAAPCVTFEEQSFCMAWASVDGPVTSNEYLRSGETVERWEKMITFKEYAGTTTVKDVVPEYMDNVRPFMAMKAEVYGSTKSTHGQDIAVELVLVAPDKSHIEYVLHRFIADDGKPVRSIAFSLRLPFAQQVDFTQVKKAFGPRLEALFALDPVTYPRLEPEPPNQPVGPAH